MFDKVILNKKAGISIFMRICTHRHALAHVNVLHLYMSMAWVTCCVISFPDKMLVFVSGVVDIGILGVVAGEWGEAGLRPAQSAYDGFLSGGLQI